jgi:competence ComEA-like helix-hairpin-helix protein
MRPKKESSTNALHGAIILGLTALLIESWAYLSPFFHEPPTHARGNCLYEIIRDGECLGAVFLDKPETVSTILLTAGISDKMALEPGEGTIPCSRILRVTGNPPEVTVEKISGPQLVNVGERVDINLADESDLRGVPGIGPILAQRIVAHRNCVGGFKRLEELKEVSGIRENKFANLSRFLELRSVLPGRVKDVQSSRGLLDPPGGIDK